MTRRIRMVVQTLAFLLFLLLLVGTQYHGDDEIGRPVKILLEIDPLHFLSTLLATGAVPGLLWLGAVTLALAFVLGRSFCGWICPLGTLVQIASKVPRRPRPGTVAENRWRPSQKIKFHLLFALLVAALFGLSWSAVFDPLSIFIRSLGLVALPALEHAVRPVFEALYRANPLGIAKVSEPVFEWLQGRLLNFHAPHFHQSLLIGLVFLVILGAAFARPRFWCRTLCPLGALLGCAARAGVFRVQQREDCSACRRCTFSCQGAADPEVPGKWRASECLVCGNCVSVCPQGLRFAFARPAWMEAHRAAGRIFRRSRKASPATPARASSGEERAHPGLELSRRHFLLAGFTGLAAVPLMRLSTSEARTHPDLIRPPGSLPEREFLERCLRCGECMKVCLTNGLQPTFLEAGLEGMWTPRLVPRIGYCEYSCTLCGQVCPTHAIRRLSPEEKNRVRIGLAFIDPARCLPHAFQRECIVCEEHCPLPRKAIWYSEVAVTTRAGETRTVKQPHVDPALCIGCGACETVCVIQDQPAIRVTCANQDRQPESGVLLKSAPSRE
ncbi:MAG: 4Fe-4S binding protein [Candidatus Eisenbacteria bacterium]|nr:4Fe-4S binding protein [Candidatus Eisenbacteria bacterium]